MSSGPEEQTTRRRGRLASRVVLGATLSGALAGAVAVATSVLAVDRLIAQRADQRLRGAADVLAGELDEGFEEGEWEPLAEIVGDENGELVTSGIRLAVFSGTHRIGGEAFVPAVASGSCETHGAVGQRVRACGRPYRDWTLIAASEADDAGLPFIYAIAGFSALLIGAGASYLASRSLTRWALRPLTQLTAAVQSLQPERAEANPLGSPGACEEVELIRDALTELLARTHHLLAQAQRLAADAAHELRTPLTTICAELELLTEDARSDERERLVRVSRRARQLTQLVERLLVLASPLEQLRAGETIALAEIIDEVVAELPPEQRARVTVEPNSEGLVRGDGALLRSLVANALDNALKFSNDERVELRIDDVTGVRDAELVQLEVRDRGPGVPFDLRTRVFEPFFRSRPDATPGHGLGLTLIGHIARAHGGHAEFVGASSTGACLQVQLPAWHPASEPPPAREA